MVIKSENLIIIQESGETKSVYNFIFMDLSMPIMDGYQVRTYSLKFIYYRLLNV